MIYRFETVRYYFVEEPHNDFFYGDLIKAHEYLNTGGRLKDKNWIFVIFPKKKRKVIRMALRTQGWQRELQQSKVRLATQKEIERFTQYEMEDEI